MKLKLVKDDGNEFDKNAIAVYLENSKVGYVANMLSADRRCQKPSNSRQCPCRVHVLF